MYGFELYIIAIIGVLELLAIATIFTFRNLLHAVLGLTFAFVINSALFLMLGQPILSIIQLFILVGGISTYTIVGVASSSFSRFKHTNKAMLFAAFIITFAVLAYPILGLRNNTSQNNVFSIQQVSQISGFIPLFYLIAIMLFGIGIGSILLFKRIGAIK